MTDTLTRLTSIAVRIFRERGNQSSGAVDWQAVIFTPDPVLREIQRIGSGIARCDAGLEEVAKQILAEPDLAPIAPRPGELDPMVLHAGGGVRISSLSIISSLLASAFARIFCLRLSRDETTFVRAVLEGFDELKRAVRGERIRADFIQGISGVALSEGRQAATPWGTLRPASPVLDNQAFGIWRLETTCLLVDTRLVSVRFDRASQPTTTLDSSESPWDRPRVLFPISCALSSKDLSNPAVPLTTWSTVLLPFMGGFSYSLPMLPPVLKAAVSMDDQVADLEECARVVDTAHVPSIDVAARRLVSACAPAGAGGLFDRRGDSVGEPCWYWDGDEFPRNGCYCEGPRDRS